jgi:hypothetical protein
MSISQNIHIYYIAVSFSPIPIFACIPTSASPLSTFSKLCPLTVLLTSTGTGGPRKCLRPLMKYQPRLMEAKPAKTTEA